MATALKTQTNLPEQHDSEIRVGGLRTITHAPRCPVGLQPVQDAIEVFLLSRRVANCSATTLRIYGTNLSRFARDVGPTTPLADVGTLVIERYLVGLRETMRSIGADQHDRTLRTFFRWSVDVGLLTGDPMRGIPRPRIPLPLPDVPTEDELRAVLVSCTTTFEGVRNSAMILTMADAGPRAGEVARARMQDWDPAELKVIVRWGKGRKDRGIKPWRARRDSNPRPAA